MNNIAKLILAASLFLLTSEQALAGPESEDEIRHEISFLAKKLLDKSDQDTVTIEQAAYMKPFIGICSDVSKSGVKLTCITPGANASKAGLKTGDFVTAINDIELATSSSKNSHRAFDKIISTMKIGDKLVMKLLRKGKRQVITVTVGAVSHPAFTLTASKK